MVRFLALKAAFLLCFAASTLVRAQSTTPDSSWRTGPLRLWVSGGLGPSKFFENSGAAVRGAISISYGRYVAMVRDMDAFDGIDGYLSTEETSTLLGYRFGGRHRYRILAIGFGNSTWKDGHGLCASVPCAFRSEGRGLAYDLGFHATRSLGGIAVNFSGVLAAQRVRVFAVVISPELGWFGK